MPEIARRGQCARLESVDITPEPEAKIMISGMLSSCAAESCAGAAAQSSAENNPSRHGAGAPHFTLDGLQICQAQQ